MKHRAILFPFLTFGLVLLTGCPQNEYTVELTPRGDVVERRLTFFRADGTDDKGAPRYQEFPSNQLAAIANCYRSDKMTRDGERHMAVGEFSGALPDDVGGVGSFLNLTNSLGSTGAYMERFRGETDLAEKATRRLKAADRLTDQILNWSKAELGNEPRYPDLRRFLDTDFRRDLQNLTLYGWLGEVATVYKAEAGEEFVVRYVHYLAERGYVRLQDAPLLFKAYHSGDAAVIEKLVQRFVAGKLGMADSAPVPASLQFLADTELVWASWEKYLAGSDLYLAKVRQWEAEKKLKPDQEKPKPSEVTEELIADLLDFRFLAGSDRLTVKLSLPDRPARTNGRWDEAQKKVIWESEIEEKNPVQLPAFCYASWAIPAEESQRRHFGSVILKGEELIAYSLWRAGLAETQAREWEKALSDLKPGDELKRKLAAFRFSGEPQGSSSESKVHLESDIPRGLIEAALENQTGPGGK